jgi:hypothetical protein
MLARRQERPLKQTRRMCLGRWASVLALVAGLSGVNVAAAQSGPTVGVIGTTDSSAMLVFAEGAAEVRAGMSVGESLRAIQTAGQMAVYDDGDNEEAEEEEEEGQEDGMLPGGQAEQRSQAVLEKGENATEDHENSGE